MDTKNRKYIEILEKSISDSIGQNKNFKNPNDKFNHLFLSLPDLPSVYLAQLNSLIYDFISNGKPERTQMCKPYDEGRMKMIDLE